MLCGFNQFYKQFPTHLTDIIHITAQNCWELTFTTVMLGLNFKVVSNIKNVIFCFLVPQLHRAVRVSTVVSLWHSTSGNS